MRSSKGLRSLAWAGALLLPTLLSAQPSSVRTYALPGGGALELTVPAGWKDSVWQRTPEAPPTITFAPREEPAFQVLVTALAPARADIQAPTADELKKIVRTTADSLASQAVEKTIDLKELKGPNVAGYYVSVTDSAPAPGEFRFMSTGVMGLGPLRVTFTILTNDGQGSVVSEALAMLARATARAGKPGARPADRLAIEGSADAFTITVPVSRLLLIVPRGGLAVENQAQGGATDNPRYFYLRDPALGLIVSGWFEPAQRFRGLDAFWKGETAGWQRQGLPEPLDARMAAIGQWETVAYESAMPGATNSHVRAHWVDAGTWIDVHLSVTNGQSPAENRKLLRRVLEAFRVQVKPQ